MNEHDLSFLRMIYEIQRKRLKYDTRASKMDVSNRCYVIFGIIALKIYKYKDGKKLEKTVKPWQELDWNQFVEQFNNTEWEEI